MGKAVTQATLIKDIMSTPVINVCLTHTVRQIIKLVKKHNVTGFPVVDINGKLIGVVSTLDLITEAALGKLHTKLGELPITIKIEKEVVKLNQYATVKDAMALFIKHRIGRIVIIDDHDKLCGIVSRKDLINFFINKYDLE